jgi:hypothetical protein
MVNAMMCLRHKGFHFWDIVKLMSVVLDFVEWRRRWVFLYLVSFFLNQQSLFAIRRNHLLVRFT